VPRRQQLEQQQSSMSPNSTVLLVVPVNCFIAAWEVPIKKKIDVSMEKVFLGNSLFKHDMNPNPNRLYGIIINTQGTTIMNMQG